MIYIKSRARQTVEGATGGAPTGRSSGGGEDWWGKYRCWMRERWFMWLNTHSYNCSCFFFFFFFSSCFSSSWASFALKTDNCRAPALAADRCSFYLRAYENVKKERRPAKEQDKSFLRVYIVFFPSLSLQRASLSVWFIARKLRKLNSRRARPSV